MTDKKLNGHPHTCTCRTCRIIALLDLLPEITGGNSGLQHGGADGGTGPQMSTEYHDRAITELRRVLALMTTTGRLNQRQHTLAYFEAEHRTVTTKVPARNAKGQIIHNRRGRRVMEDGPRVLERIVPPWVRLDRVRHGIAYIESEYGNLCPNHGRFSGTKCACGHRRQDPTPPAAVWMTTEQYDRHRQRRKAVA